MSQDADFSVCVSGTKADPGCQVSDLRNLLKGQRRLKFQHGNDCTSDKIGLRVLKEEEDRQYEAYTEFDRIARGSCVSMVDYIIEFEHRYNKI
ncbi:hypothetical protein JOB18_000802, partial [Solea senegalensis]